MKKRLRKRRIKKERKKVLSSLDWMDIETVEDDHIVLKRDGVNEVVYGIKIEPHPIFLDSSLNQILKKNQLRSLWNRFKIDVYHGFVFNPINLDIHYSNLQEQYYKFEDDEILQDMILDDIAKAEAYQRAYRELEFVVMIKGKPSKKFERAKDHFFHEFRRSSIKHKQMNKIDFINYITNKFESSSINDVFYSRGIFSNDEEVAYEQIISEK